MPVQINFDNHSVKQSFFKKKKIASSMIAYIPPRSSLDQSNLIELLESWMTEISYHAD